MLMFFVGFGFRRVWCASDSAACCTATRTRRTRLHSVCGNNTVGMYRLSQPPTVARIAPSEAMCSTHDNLHA